MSYNALYMALTCAPMTDGAAVAYEAWKRADAEARVAEQQLAEVWDLFASKKGESPPPELVHEVARLRTVASSKLTAALRAIDDAKGQ